MINYYTIAVSNDLEVKDRLIKSFEIFWLFIKDHLTTATMVNDDDACLKNWKEQMINKFVSIAIGVSIFLVSSILLRN
ncbi:hypothetical protein CXP39_01825 [Mesoplasma syrphidae]|uniref:Uncharacterized protein n=1 Tax=Mesoplasma syrphidae TaxID=225999 RepID=A0A2K9C227_9MOLU|nr:hypothetical protein [Mesoplasma syrphidae]AUF83529.1 hypothetical protein CXP39_01825 [Mesoplasma syrphidae]